MAQPISCFIPSMETGGSDAELERLIKPARFFEHPLGVLKDPSIGYTEKRAILSSCASNACTVDTVRCPQQPPRLNKPIFFDDVMDARRELDRQAGGSVGPAGEMRLSESKSLR